MAVKELIEVAGCSAKTSLLQSDGEGWEAAFDCGGLEAAPRVACDLAEDARFV
jgi:hypothetical protein